ncbi:MAG: tetratricopeptide repeat protein [Candidatus Aminicenantales bacterium]
MKRETTSVAALALLFAGLSSLRLAQEDYTREERLLYQKFKVANAFFERGQEQFLKENFKKAEKEFRKCLNTMPQHADAYFFLAQISYRWGNIEKALEEIEKAEENYHFIGKMKSNREQLYLLELQKIKQQKEEQLQELMQRLATASDADRSKIQAAIGGLEGELGAIRSRLSRPVPSPEVTPADYSYVHGNILFRLKRYTEARDQWLLAIGTDPKHGQAYNNLANLYYLAKQYEKALGYLEMAEANGISVNPEFKKALLRALGKKRP